MQSEVRQTHQGDYCKMSFYYLIAVIIFKGR
jgi:hypothetical protein